MVELFSRHIANSDIICARISIESVFTKKNRNKFMKMNSVIAAALASVFFGATNAHAIPVIYTDFASWSGAVSGQATVTIPNPSSQAGYDFFGTDGNTGDGSVTYSGVTFSANPALSNGNFYNIGPVFSGSPAVLASQEQTLGVANILITFLKPTTAFWLNFGTFDGGQVTFSLSNGDTFSRSSTGDGYLVSDFVGVTDKAFSSILITSPDIVLSLNNLVYAVPEASTWIMLVLGFAGVGFLGYRGSARGPVFAANRRSA
jgi:hypothetical protein